MNEQIKQLWVQAAETTQGDSWEDKTKFIERFAELIVLECMRMCEVTEMSWGYTRAITTKLKEKNT